MFDFKNQKLTSHFFLVVLLFLPCFNHISLAANEKIVPQSLQIQQNWKDIAPEEKLMVIQDKINGIVIHHTAGRAPAEADEAMILKNIQNYHMAERKWGDIAYHLLITPSGKVYEGRNPKFAGDSGTKYDTNGRLMICFLGTYDKHLPSPVARHTLKKILKAKLAEYKLQEKDICCHRDLAQTDCPGNALYAWIKAQKWGFN